MLGDGSESAPPGSECENATDVGSVSALWAGRLSGQNRIFGDYFRIGGNLKVSTLASCLTDIELT